MSQTFHLVGVLTQIVVVMAPSHFFCFIVRWTVSVRRGDWSIACSAGKLKRGSLISVHCGSQSLFYSRIYFHEWHAMNPSLRCTEAAKRGPKDGMARKRILRRLLSFLVRIEPFLFFLLSRRLDGLRRWQESVHRVLCGKVGSQAGFFFSFRVRHKRQNSGFPPIFELPVNERYHAKQTISARF